MFSFFEDKKSAVITFCRRRHHPLNRNRSLSAPRGTHDQRTRAAVEASTSQFVQFVNPAGNRTDPRVPPVLGRDQSGKYDHPTSADHVVMVAPIEPAATQL